MSETKDWRKICAACNEGDPPKDCEYYGEPNGCNSPTYGKHPTCKDSLQVGNEAKMRAALSDACYAMHNFLKTKYGGYEEMAKALDKAKAALAAPPRNCDVGTANEQAKRFADFVCDRRGDLDCTGKCPAHNGVDFGVVDCVIQWEQMPYEKEGAE